MNLSLDEAMEELEEAARDMGCEEAWRVVRSYLRDLESEVTIRRLDAEEPF